MIAPLWRRPSGRQSLVGTAGFVIGGALLIWSSYIHFHLWDSLGYRHIPTIGPLFAAQFVAALVIGVASVVVRRLWVALVGLGFAVSTIAGFVISVSNGLFNFKDSWYAPDAKLAFGVELAAAAIFLATAAVCAWDFGPRSVAAGSQQR
jgi:hypothetical protein